MHPGSPRGTTTESNEDSNTVTISQDNCLCVHSGTNTDGISIFQPLLANDPDLPIKLHISIKNQPRWMLSLGSNGHNHPRLEEEIHMRPGRTHFLTSKPPESLSYKLQPRAKSCSILTPLWKRCQFQEAVWVRDRVGVGARKWLTV